MSSPESVWRSGRLEGSDQIDLPPRPSPLIISESLRVQAWASGQIRQLYCLPFRADEWSGRVLKCTNETTDAGRFTLDEFDDMQLSLVTKQSVEDVKAFTGTLICKLLPTATRPSSVI